MRQLLEVPAHSIFKVRIWFDSTARLQRMWSIRNVWRVVGIEPSLAQLESSETRMSQKWEKWLSCTYRKLQAPVDGKWKMRSSTTYFTRGGKGVALGGWNYPVRGGNILLPFLEEVHNLFKEKSSTWFMFKCNCILITSCISRSLYLDFLTSMLVLSRMEWPRSMLCCATADFLSWYRMMWWWWWWWWSLNLILIELQVCPIYTYPNLQGMLYMSNDMGLKIPDIYSSLCECRKLYKILFHWKQN